MKAKDISGQAPGGKRTRLADVLPLDTPFVVQIFPIYACNFKCSYCIFSVEKPKRGFISDQISMKYELYKQSIDDMSRFSNKIKVLRFVGIGEPLLHKKIVDMIRYAYQQEVAEKIELLTNASLLNQNMSDALIDAGLDRLVVSVQGTSAKKYRKMCGAKINLGEFLGNLKYFYERKSSTHVYIKIVDTALENAEDEEQFYKLFGDYSDTIAIEHTVPIHHGIDYGKVLDGEKHEITQFGLPVSEVQVCPQPFFTMQINPDGKVVPCYSFEYPCIMGDCNLEPANKIWASPKFNQFRRKMLDGAKQTTGTCKECSIIKFRLFPEDDLSQDAERLIPHFV